MPFTSPVERTEAPGTGDEREQLNAYLDFQRATILRKLDGLGDADLRRAVAPSGLTLLGILKHLADVEHGWFVVNFARTGEEFLFQSESDPDLDLHVQDNETTDEIVKLFLEMCERSRAIVEAASLDDRVPNQRRGEIDLRWIMLHLIEEYARHNGHADIIRELIDGATGI